MPIRKFEIRKTVLFSILLMAITWGVYAQVGNHQFINLDDPGYLTNNPYVTGGLTGRNIVWAFTTIDCFYWQPVTWLSHMADVQLYGMDPRGHHLTSVVLHIFSALLLFFLFLRLTGEFWKSSFVAFLFALHPQSVESVAWAAERKDVLSALFGLVTLLIYVEFTAKRKLSLYISSLCFFIVALMSKPMVVTLPVIMLLLDFWPLGRIRYNGQVLPFRKCLEPMKSLLVEKIPFFACSLFSVAITVYGHNQAGGLRNLNEIPVWLRVENALVSYGAYIGKTFIPLDLAVLYPFPAAIAFWKVTGALIALLFISITAFRVRHRQPYVVVGWCWFLVTLLPVIGLLQTGEQAMADRFSYIPRIGLFVVVAWGASELANVWRSRHLILALVAGAVLIVSTSLTWRQVGYWQDDISIFKRTLKLTSGNYTIHNNLGLALAEQGDLQGAMKEYRAAIRIKPDNPFPHNNLGLALAKLGEIDAAISEYHTALRLSPDYATSHNNLGMALANKGDFDAALQKYRDALDISPDYADAYYNMGLAYARKGDFHAAISAYREALRITPNDSDTHVNLGTAYAGIGQLDLAIEQFQKVTLINPDNQYAQNNLQIALTQKRMQESAGSFSNTPITGR